MSGEITKTEVKLHWDKYTNLADDEFEKYEVQYSKRASPEESPGSIAITENNCIINGLDGATGYDIQVRVKSKNFGYSDFSEKLVVYTKETSISDQTAVQKLYKSFVSYHIFYIKKKKLHTNLHLHIFSEYVYEGNQCKTCKYIFFIYV